MGLPSRSSACFAASRCAMRRRWDGTSGEGESFMIDVQPKTPRALGPGFWAAWLLALATLVAAFFGALWFAQTQLEGAPGTVTEAAATILFAVGMIAISLF